MLCGVSSFRSYKCDNFFKEAQESWKSCPQSRFTSGLPHRIYFNTRSRIMVSATAAPRRTTKVNIKLLSIAS